MDYFNQNVHKYDLLSFDVFHVKQKQQSKDVKRDYLGHPRVT